jgi:hypothetical protein
MSQSTITLANTLVEVNIVRRGEIYQTQFQLSNDTKIKYTGSGATYATPPIPTAKCYVAKYEDNYYLLNEFYQALSYGSTEEMAAIFSGLNVKNLQKVNMVGLVEILKLGDAYNWGDVFIANTKGNKKIPIMEIDGLKLVDYEPPVFNQMSPTVYHYNDQYAVFKECKPMKFTGRYELLRCMNLVSQYFVLNDSIKRLSVIAQTTTSLIMQLKLLEAKKLFEPIQTGSLVLRDETNS